MTYLMKNALTLTSIALLGIGFAAPLRTQVSNGGFETGDPKQSIKLEDDRYLVEVSRCQGAVTRLRDKKGGLELISEPRLADNFRFTLPIPGKEPWQTIEANYIWGKQQKLSSFDVTAKDCAPLEQTVGKLLGREMRCRGSDEHRACPGWHSL